MKRHTESERGLAASKRLEDFLAVKHKPKMIAHEPIMEFDLEIRPDMGRSLRL